MHPVMFDLAIPTGKITSDSDYAVLFGYEPTTFEETVDSWLERVHPQEREAVYAAYENCRTGQTSDFVIEHRQQVQSGDWIWLLSIGKVVETLDDGTPARILGTHTPITTDKESLILLGQGDALIKSALDTINEALIIISKAGKVLYYNRRFLEIWSLPPANYLGQDRGFLVETVRNQLKDPANFAKNYAKLYDTNQFIEDILEMADGRFIRLITYPLLEKGEVYGRIWMLRDVTERRRFIQEIQERESQLSVMFNQSNELLALIRVEANKTLTIAQLNDHYLQVLGVYGVTFNVDEVIGKELGTYLDEDIGLTEHQQNYTLRYYHQAIETGQPVSYEEMLVMPEGNAYTEVILKPIFDPSGVCNYVLYSSRDVTKQIEASKNLRLVSFAIENVSDAVVWMNEASEIVNINQAVCTMLGYEHDEIIGMSMMKLSPILEQAGPPVLWAALKERQSFIVESELRTKSGHMLPVEVTANYIEFDDQELNCAIIRDITDRRKAEEATRSAHEELERNVAERTAQLQAANAELESFAYSVSHDLRAPLRAIDGFSQALLEDYEDQLDDIGKSYLNRVRAASQNMGQLIDDLLNLSRLTRQEMVLENVNLSALAHEIVNQLREAEPERSVQVEIEENIVAYADRRLLYVALVNLIHNAWKFTSKRESALIKFSKLPAIKGIQDTFYVADNGAGFDTQYINKLFNAFQRLHTQEEFSGTGIGLATVKRIVDRHGGHVWAEAQIDGGATFYFTLSQDTKNQDITNHETRKN